MKLVKKYLNPNTGSDKLDINGSSNPYADFATKWQQATDRGETSDPMEETRQRILDRLNNNTYYWIDTDGSIKQDYLTDDAAVEDYRRKSGTATPLNWEFNIIAPARFGLGAIGNGIRTGLQAMNTAFTPSTWLNPVTGAKLLSPTVGTIADAGIQGAFAYEGLNGLWNQGRQGTLSSDPGSTVMHGLEVLPLISLGGRAVGSAYRNFANNNVVANNTVIPRRTYSKPKVDITPVEGNITTSDIPAITAENAASITPELWTAAQDAAISRGDWDEVYRLSDLHLRTKASEVGTPLTDDNGKLLRLYRGSQKDENIFTSWDPDNPTWATTDKHYAINYTKPRVYDPDGTIRMLKSDPSKVKNLYGVYNKKAGPIEDIDNIKAWKAMYDDEFNTDLVFGHDYKVDHSKVIGFNDSNGIEYAFSRPTLLKSADPITYDNFGKRIGLGDRHNFSNPDIRWGLFPLIFGGGTAGYNYLNQDNTSSKYTNGGKLLKRKL